MDLTIDTHGQRISEKYNVLLTQPFFEQRLKAFDPNLRLVFDQTKKRWTILEKERGGPGFKILIVAQEDNGDPKPLGEWVFNKLFVWRKKWEEKADMGVDAWFKKLVYEADIEKNLIEEKASEEHQAMLRDDINQWRKVSRELQNLPTSDVTAGYAK